MPKNIHSVSGPQSQKGLETPVLEYSGNYTYTCHNS
jgi:hypothetical protein